MVKTLNTWTGIQESNIYWIPVLSEFGITLGSKYKIVPTEGYLAWEYNPLRNYRLNQSMYEKDGKYYTESELCSILSNLQGSEVSLFQEETPIPDMSKYSKKVQDEFELYTLKEPGELVDFITSELSFSLSHPVEILPQYSYDGSVNLILNDGLNIPRMINSRFTVTGKNTYKIIDRKGDNDTNIYDQGSQFDVDTSLFKNVNKIPKLEYLGTSNGNMKIGNYHFYFKYSDVDGNESDWVAESGLVSVFMGNTPQSVNTGIRDENSIKSVRFKLSNIDMGYSYVKVYYTRYTADVDSNLVVQAKRIDKNFLITSAGISHILITGDENETEVTLEEINSSFDVIQTAQTQCTASNRLFMANIHKTKVEYEMLAKLSLCFCPYKQEETYPLINGGITETYDIRAKSDGYYDTQYIYDKTGYWPGELYRFGVVYLLKDGSLSPVFNIRGATNVPIKSNTNEFFYSIENKLNDKNCKITDVLASIDYSEENYMIIGGTAPNENAKGVVQFSEFNTCVFPVVGLQITADKRAVEELKKYVKGFFFVRQKRIPLTLSQGLVVGLDNESRTPTIPTYSGLLDSINYNNTYIETSDKNNINFVSEGFLSHYSFEITEKDDNHNNKLWKALGIVGLVALGVALSVVTCGAGAVLFGAAVATVTPIATSILTGTLAATFVAASVTTMVINDQHYDYVKMQERNARKAEAVKGRKDKIPEGYKRKEISTSRILTQDITKRYVIKDGSKNTPGAIIIPDYQVNQPFYNQFLTGDKFTVKMTFEQPSTNYLTDGYLINDYRHFYVGTYKYQTDNRPYLVNLVGVPDSCPIKMIQDNKYCARAGYPEEAYKYEFQGVTYEDTSNKIANSDIIRGNFGSFVGMYGYKGHAGDQVEIKIPGYTENNLGNYLQIRAQDTSAFYAISDRIDINNLKDDQYLKESSNNSDFVQTFYRGDSYICQYTHRLLRNFNDPSAPYNDKIVDEKTWKQNYDPDKTEKYANINLGDVNAVQLGLWLTFNVRSSYNLNIRTVDKSHIDESIMSGNYRSFYPNYGQLASGNQKIPDSDQYNKGFSKSVSEKYYFEVPDVPYIKQEFQNRIVFSDIHINDAYKNGFRVLRAMNHKDYPMTYGSITKLIEIQNALMIIFEHGIGMVSVNNNSEHPSQILSDLQVISDTYGSQWKDSIIKTPSGIYGVDTVAKKIWRVKEGQIELISDMHVQEFLNQNITLSERELTPTLGIRNVKTVYNAFKHDIMFTFYDGLYETSEKAWNLCWNEILGIFTTFYSWIPSEMENIDNIPFSFNRNTVKSISKLGISNHDNDFSEGITLSNNVLYLTDNGFEVKNKSIDLMYLNQSGEPVPYDFDLNILKEITDKPGFIGFIYLDKRLPDNKSDYKITYELIRDNQENHKKFAINTEDISLKDSVKTLHGDVVKVSVSYLTLTEPNANFMLSELYYRNKENHSYADIDANKVGPGELGYNIGLPIFKNKLGKRINLPKELQINPDKIVRYLNIKATVSINTNSSLDYVEYGSFESSVAITTQHNLSLLSTDFWKHGQAGLIDICDKTYPTYWYGQQHPFEFECVVVDDPSVHKIFTNLELVANKVKPESFHYEVVGDVYDFSEDKPTMYFRQEALKALYQYNGYDIEYNPNFLEIEPKQHNRSADLPKYYYRWDTINEIYDCYKRFSDQIGFNYNHLAGAEIVYYPTRNEFRVWNHAEAIDVDSLSQDLATSVIKANCRYLEDKWLVSINPIVVTYKNEIDKSKVEPGTSMFSKDAYGIYKYSTWVEGKDGSLLPPISIQGTKTSIKSEGDIRFPGDDPENPTLGKDNALYGLYNLDSWNKGNWKPIDPVRHSDRRETDVRGKFMKVRIRYSGEELAIIDFLNTIYQISFA